MAQTLQFTRIFNNFKSKIRLRHRGLNWIARRYLFVRAHFDILYWQPAFCQSAEELKRTVIAPTSSRKMIFILRPSKNNLHICPVSTFFKRILIIPFLDFKLFQEKLSKTVLFFQGVANRFRVFIFFDGKSLDIDLRGFDIRVSESFLSFRHQPSARILAESLKAVSVRKC